MIAACPRCKTRYRIEREKLRPEGVRLRCTRCEALFRVRAPQEEAPPRVETPGAAPAGEAPVREPDGALAGRSVSDPVPTPPAPAATEAGPRIEATSDAPEPEPRSLEGLPRVGLALPDEDVAKATAQALREAGFAPFLVRDGVDAMLEIQRQLPDVMVLSATLPKMYGFQVCEVVKRNESLRRIHVVLVGAIHHKERYRRAPSELYGADAYVEEPDLPEALLPILARFGLGSVGEAGPSEPDPAPVAPPVPETPVHEPVPTAMSPSALAAPSPDEPSAALAPPAPDDPAQAPVSPGSAALASPSPLETAAAAASPAESLRPPEPAASPAESLRPPEPAASPAESLRPPEPAASPAESLRPPEPAASPAESLRPPEPAASPAESLRPPEPAASSAPASRPPRTGARAAPSADDGLEPERDKAERLARIIVSDIVLYNEARFSEALRVGNVVEALSAEVTEGRALFAERVDERVRGERDHLVDELLRVARSRGMG